MKCDSHAFFLACTLESPCFGREPKARVVTEELWRRKEMRFRVQGRKEKENKTKEKRFRV
jgi:hypothetical protein